MLCELSQPLLSSCCSRVTAELWLPCSSRQSRLPPAVTGAVYFFDVGALNVFTVVQVPTLSVPAVAAFAAVGTCLAALLLGAMAFIVGVVLQLTGSPHIGLAISMVGVMMAVAGGLRRPRGSH